jgi:hypothetical protein
MLTMPCMTCVQVAEPIEYLRRPDRLGLGAKPVPVVPEDPNKKKIVKMGRYRQEQCMLCPSSKLNTGSMVVLSICTLWERACA